jgi:uncharacterized protein YjbI with pentapeptide repeats
MEAIRNKLKKYETFKREELRDILLLTTDLCEDIINNIILDYCILDLHIKSGSDLTSIDLSDSHNNITIYACNVKYVKFNQGNLSKLVLIHVSMYNTQFKNAILNHTHFTKCNLINCQFNNAKLINVDFINCNMSGTNFVNADLTNGRIINCKLKGANFDGAILHNCNLCNIVLVDIDFSKADLTGAITNNRKFHNLHHETVYRYTN